MKLPRYVSHFIDRHGHARFYFRREGFPRATLPGLPWSPEFMAAYEAALRCEPEAPNLLGSIRSKPGSVAAAVATYFASAAWTNDLSDSSRDMRRPILERFRVDHGDKMLANLKPEHVQAMVRRLKPNAQRNFVMAVRGLMVFAVRCELIGADPTAGVVRDKIARGPGHHNWTEADVQKYRERQPLGSQARLAMEIMLNLGVRKSDAMRIGPADIRDGWLTEFEPQKTSRTTGMKVNIPIRPELAEAIAATKVIGTRTYLVHSHGKAHGSSKAFGNWMRDRYDEAGLPDCANHGLRKLCLTRLAEAGCSVFEIMAISGHKDAGEVQTYVDKANRKKLAAQGTARLDNTKA
jgi:integrase